MQCPCEQHAQVGNVVFERRDALHADAEREARVLLGIIGKCIGHVSNGEGGANGIAGNTKLAAFFGNSLGEAVYSRFGGSVGNGSQQATANLTCDGRNVHNTCAAAILKMLPKSMRHVIGAGKVGVAYGVPARWAARLSSMLQIINHSVFSAAVSFGN